MSGHPNIAPARLFEALTQHGLPAPIGVEPVGTPRVHAVYRLRFEGARVDSMLLRVALHCPGWDTIATERAALNLVADMPVVPTAPEYHVLPARVLGFTAALVSDLPGQSGTDLLAHSPELGPAIASVFGEIRTALDELQFATPAVRGTGTLGFLPLRAGWRAEWSARGRGRKALLYSLR